MVKNVNGCKNPNNSLVLQLSKRQILTFLPRLSFGTVRSEVRILSPRPLLSTTYGCQHWRPYFICGQFVDIFFNQSNLTRESMGSNISFGSLHIAMTHQCFDRECVITCNSQPRTECGSEIMPFEISEF